MSAYLNDYYRAGGLYGYGYAFGYGKGFGSIHDGFVQGCCGPYGIGGNGSYNGGVCPYYGGGVCGNNGGVVNPYSSYFSPYALNGTICSSGQCGRY